MLLAAPAFRELSLFFLKYVFHLPLCMVMNSVSWMKQPYKLGFHCRRKHQCLREEMCHKKRMKIRCDACLQVCRIPSCYSSCWKATLRFVLNQSRDSDRTRGFLVRIPLLIPPSILWLTRAAMLCLLTASWIPRT